jgi:uncharacterized protein (DUF1810 family)
MADLARFKTAQEAAGDGFATALRELRAGRKTSHWIWYVFPQIEGLGSSPAARHYALAGPREAEAYLRDPVLGERLLAATEAAHRHLSAQPPAPIQTLRLRATRAKSVMDETSFSASMEEPISPPLTPAEIAYLSGEATLEQKREAMKQFGKRADASPDGEFWTCGVPDEDDDP